MYAVQFALIWFWKNNLKYDPIRAVFIKCHPNTSNIIRFCVVFGFLRLVCGFNLDWFEFEHPKLAAYTKII